MIETADVVVVGAGVQGASLAFHLARRGASVVVVERETVAAGATGRSSGFVRMHYDLESEMRLAWLSFPYFRSWAEQVGAGDPGFVRTGFLHAMPEALAAPMRANIAVEQGLGVPVQAVEPAEIARLVPGAVTDGLAVGAYEPESGYADPSGTAAGFLAAARRLGTRLVQGSRVRSIAVEGDAVSGVDTDRGSDRRPRRRHRGRRLGARTSPGPPASSCPSSPGATRRPTSACRPATGRTSRSSSTRSTGSTSGPRAATSCSSGWRAATRWAARRTGRSTPRLPATIEDMVRRVCARVPWMTEGTFRTAHGGQDGITPDQRPILGRAGPDGLFVACGFSGTGFKTAPAIGACLAELILDGRTTTADISAYGLDRFAAGRPLVGEHSYGVLWR